MEWEELQLHLAEGHRASERAANDLDFARAMAEKAFQLEDQDKMLPDTLRKPLQRLLKALKDLPEGSARYLHEVGIFIGKDTSVGDFITVVDEALDLMKVDGRRPSPIREAVRWLLMHYTGQGERITITLYGPDAVPDRPSDCIKWLTAEIKKFRPTTHEREIYELLRSPSMRPMLNQLQKPPSNEG